MGKNIIIACLLVLLLGTNAWQVYGTVDQAITMSYMDQELYELRRSEAQLEKLLLNYVGGQSAAEIEALLAEQFPDEIRFTKDGYVTSGSLSFKLDSARQQVVSIGFDPET